MNSIIKDTIVLFVITLISGVALGAVHEVTLEPIAAASAAAANKTYSEVYPDAVTFEETDDLAAAVETANAEADNWGIGSVSINDAMVAKDASGNEVGYVINSSSGSGYGGTIEMSVGITNEGKMTGIGFLTINETPGLGLKAKNADFRDQFVGKDATGALESIKTGTATDQQFMAISGASFTSGAVSEAVNAAIKFLNEYVK